MAKKEKKEKLDVAAVLAAQVITAPASLEEAQEVAREWSKKRLLHDKLTIARDKKTYETTTEYADQLEDLDGEIDILFRRLRAFFRSPENQALYMGDKRSCAVSNVCCSLRTSPGKVQIVGTKKEDEIVKEIMDSGDRTKIRRYLSLTPKLDRSAILDIWDRDQAARKWLEGLNIVVTKDELFALTDLGREEITNKQTQA